MLIIKSGSWTQVTAANEAQDYRKVSDCMYYHLKGLRYTIEVDPQEKWSKTRAVSKDSSDTSCDQKNIARLVIDYEYEGTDNTITDMNTSFTMKYNNGWEITDVVLGLEVPNNRIDKNYTLVSTNAWLQFPGDQSFSCKQLEFENLHGGNYPRIKIILDEFQIQPFPEPKNTIFAPSYDCSTWLTLPLISGFILILFMTFVIIIILYLMVELGEQTKDLKFSKQGGILMNQSQLEATSG